MTVILSMVLGIFLDRICLSLANKKIVDAKDGEKN